MSDKLKLEDIDWSKAPVDAEEGCNYISGDVLLTTWYKDVKPSGYYYKTNFTPQWTYSSGIPLFDIRIKRPSNIFTKSMLVAGKHIVETSEVRDKIYEVIALDDDVLMLSDGQGDFIGLDDYLTDLKFPDDEYSIVKIYTRTSSRGDLKLIWERTPTKVPTQKELQLSALQDTINKAQEQIEELMKG